MSKGSVYLNIPGIGRVIAIRDKVLFKLRVSFDGLVIRKKVFPESIRRIETQIDVSVEVMRSRALSSLSYVLMGSSYNFDEMISFFRVHMPQIFVDFSPSNGGAR